MTYLNSSYIQQIFFGIENFWLRKTIHSSFHPSIRYQQRTMSDDYDPFECRLEFTSLLQKLNASQQSIQKVANYAMRNKRLSEDLYSCVLESLEQVSLDHTSFDAHTSPLPFPL